MKKIFLSLFTAIASLAAQAQPMAVPIHTQIAEHYFEDQSYASMMEVDVNWEIAPPSGWGSYAQFYTRFQAGERSGAYMGLQQDDRDGKKIIFSMWDASASHKVRPYALPHCQRFSHEGLGAMCIMKFQWKPGVKYKLVMGIIPAKAGDVGFTRWGGWLVESTGAETFIGGYEVPNYNGLQGVGGLYPPSIMMVMEYYLAPKNVQCSSLPQQSLTWSGLRVNGNRKPKNVSVRYQTFLSDCVNSEYVRSYAKGTDSITQTTNMLSVPRATQGPFLWTADNVTPVPQPTTPVVPAPTTPVVTTPSGSKMTTAFRNQVVCTYGRVMRHFKEHFSAGIPIREYVTDTTYQIAYPEDQWGKNGSTVMGLGYTHSMGQMTVIWPDGTRQEFGDVGMWIALAGC